VHSPVVGPSTWRWVAQTLRAGGHRVVVPDLVAAARTGSPLEYATAAAASVDARASDTNGGDDTVLVGHSGAGAVLPLVAAALTTPPRRLVFVDAGLPPTVGVFSAGGGFLPTLRGLARDGLLPRWSEWWGAGALEALIPEESRRAAVGQELPLVPISFYETPIEVPAGWSERRGAYLLSSEGYREDADRAAALGWPVVERMGGHLAIVNDEVSIAERLVSLA
jgi:alpha-beta hydrolase superfamily lysophospholipase